MDEEIENTTISQFLGDITIPTVIIDSGFSVIDSSKSFQDLVSGQEISSVKDIISDELFDGFKNSIEKCERSNKSECEIILNLENDVTVNAIVYINKLAQDKYVMQIIDTTETKNLEERYAHSQKMQAVGQLAGGVAHDFNNLLTAMIGFTDLLLMRHPPGDKSFADLMQIKQNSNRASALVRQLLAFSRRQTLKPKTLEITEVVADLSNLIGRLIGETIELEIIHGNDLGYVKADQGQLEQVFVNLCVNARDAMVEGGKLTLKSRVVKIENARSLEGYDKTLISPPEEDPIEKGEYICVEISDTGCGIDKENIRKIFEPFYSTKEVGSGTGLGLATVYGIVKQTEGYIYVSSEPGKGTKFALFFPRHQEGGEKTEGKQEELVEDLTGDATILIVEDEAPVRIFAVRALKNKGFDVYEADCAESAMEIIEKKADEIDIVISDVIMPGMNGPDLAKEIKKKKQDVKVIFISGYAEDAFADGFDGDEEFNFLPKPFTLKQLVQAVKELNS